MRPFSTACRLARGIALLALLVACGPGDPPDGPPSETGTPRTYRVRGILQALPDPETGAGQLRIHHEAIPDLVGASGEVEPMPAMTMSFPVASEVDLAGLAAGDLVRFDLRIDWQAARPVAVTAIEKLPAGTELNL
jgi:Cu/Ag efflux protein CusF